MHKENSSKYLVDKILNMVFTEVLPGVNNSMKICLHQVGNDVDIAVIGPSLWLKDIQQSNDVVVLEKF